MEEIGISATALESLERDFEGVIKDLGGEDNLERFRLEYEKLHRALKKSHESEKRLIKKCQELSQEIMANAARVQSALKLSQDDQNTIESLKNEIEKAWKMVDTAHEKESRAKETIQQLKKEAATLSQLVDQGASLTEGQSVSLEQLTEAKKDLERELTDLNQRIELLSGEMKEQQEKLRALETDHSGKEEEIKRYTEKLITLRREHEREVKSKDRAEGQIKELMSVLQVRDNECDVRNKSIKAKGAHIEQQTSLINAEQTNKMRLAKQYEATKSELTLHEKGRDDNMETAARLTEQLNALDDMLKKREEQIQQLRYEEQKMQKTKDQKIKELKRVAQQKDDIKKEHEMLQRQIVNFQKQIDSMVAEEKALDQELLKIEAHQVKLDKRVDDEKQRQGGIENEIKSVEDLRREYEEFLENERLAGVELRQEVARLEAEREKYAEDASSSTVKFNHALEDVKIGMMRIEDLQKQIEEAAKRLANQQGMYEQVRSDRNLYSKNFIESQDEISELKQKFKIMDHQIDQLKEELSMKEKKYFEEQARQKNQKEKYTKIQKQKNELKALHMVARARTQSLNQEIKQLTKVINQCDQELSEQQQHFLTVTNERDILGTQLIRRNDELALLYEKIRIQQSTLSKGEVQYRDRLVDLRMLRLKMAELKRNVHMAQVRVKNIDELKAQIEILQRQLSLERTKVQALSEELENPQNYLRWRKLEGSDLKEAEMVQKIQTLQKRLIAKTEECVEKDVIVQEKEKLYIELKTILARQPGPEVAEQLNVYQQDLRKKNVQMKCMASELNMSSTQVAEYKYEVERLNRELQEMKKHYFELKMNNQLLTRERSGGATAGASRKPPQQSVSRPQFGATM